ncbi:MAG: MFS transporter [Saprospiraceae bacterium]|nr:MFS transporter [Saprospiraceae bacterium]
MQSGKSYHYYRVFAAACVGMLLFGIVMLSLGSTLPEITRKYQLDDVSAGSLASLLPTGILVGSLIFGPIVDRFSYKYLLVLCSVIIAIGMGGIASASGLFFLQLSFFLIGFGGGAINGGTNALVADISHDHQKTGSANLSLLGVFFGVGALSMPSVMAMLSKWYPYDQILLGIGAVIMIPALFFFTINYPEPKQKQSVSIVKSASLFKDQSLLILAFVLFFQSAFEGIFNNWTTTYLQRIRGFSESEALTVLSIYVIGLTATRLLLAGLLRTISEKLVLYLSICSLILGVCGLMIFHDIIAVYFVAAVLGIGTAAVFPTILGFVGELYQKLRGTAFSVVFFIAVFGNILVNFLVGLLSEKMGISRYPSILLGVVIMILVVFTIYDRSSRKGSRH